MEPWNSRFGVGALDLRTLDVDGALRVIDVDGRRGCELNVFAISKLQHRDGGVRFELLRVLERTVKRGVEFRLASDVGGLVGRIDGEQRAERDALRIEGGVGRVVAGKRDFGVGLDGGVDSRGGQLSGGLVVGEVCLKTDVGDGLLLDDEARNLDGRVELRIIKSALSFRVEC